MSYWTAILLGIIEGVTEFLPVSSTGHLLIAEHWVPRQSELFNVVIQCGAVLAVLAVFWRRALDLLTDWRQPDKLDYLLKLAVAYVLTCVGGFALKKAGFKLPERILPVAVATLAGGVLILLIEWGLRGRRLSETVTWPVAFVVGAAQLLAAACPGTSRSGATILFALAVGLSRARATEFSFLLGIPTMLTASSYEILQELKQGGASQSPWDQVLLGTVVSALTAFVVVRWLLRYVQSHTFVPFGWYRIALGAALLGLLMFA